MSVLVFDIETVPDVESGRRLYGLEGLGDEDVGKAMEHRRVQQTGGSSFMPLHLHRVVAISVVLQKGSRLSVWSLGDLESDEKDIVQRFYHGVERYQPTLVSWNGSGFDLPVLHYRGLLHQVDARHYWDVGEDDRDMKWNNYISRYHWRHTDLMDVLAGFQPRAAAKLDEVATMLGFPGKMGMSGAKVWDNYLAGDLEGIRNYCETDVLNTYLVYLRFQHMRGNLDDTELASRCDDVRSLLKNEDKPHFTEFLETWNAQEA